jgi:hypothetical protein
MIMDVLLLALLVCLPAAVRLTARLSRARRPAVVPGHAASVGLPQSVNRRTAGWRWAGLAGGLVAGGAAASSGALGRGLLLAAPLLGLCVLAGVVVGETGVRPPAGRTRVAALETRSARDYLPRRLATAVTAAATLLLALLAITTATGAADDLGRSGRIVLLQCSQALRESARPWPGSFYSVPLAALVAAGLIMAGTALRVVAGRPRTGAGEAAVAADDALRHRASRAITSACGILVALPLAGCCVVTGVALLSLTCRPAWMTLAAWAVLAVAPPALALIGWCTVVVLGT